MSADDWAAGLSASVEMPGRVLALQASNKPYRLWALCEIERKWWQLWLPKKREEWVSVETIPPR